MAGDIPRIRERGAAAHGRKAGQVHIRAEGRRRLRRRRRRHGEDRGDGGVRHNVDVAAQEVVRAVPPGRRGGPAPEAHAPRAPGGGRRDLLAHRQRLRAPADSDVPQGGGGGRDSRQDRAQDDARDGDSPRRPGARRPTTGTTRTGASSAERSRTRSRGISTPGPRGGSWGRTSPSSRWRAARPTGPRRRTSAPRRSWRATYRPRPTWPSR